MGMSDNLLTAGKDSTHARSVVTDSRDLNLNSFEKLYKSSSHKVTSREAL